jgi:hypothetical protein
MMVMFSFDICLDSIKYRKLLCPILFLDFCGLLVACGIYGGSHFTLKENSAWKRLILNYIKNKVMVSYFFSIKYSAFCSAFLFMLFPRNFRCPFGISRTNYRQTVF